MSKWEYKPMPRQQWNDTSGDAGGLAGVGLVVAAILIGGSLLLLLRAIL